MPKSFLKKFGLVPEIVRQYRLRNHQPSWRELLGGNALWKRAVAAPRKQKILLATSTGGYFAATRVESMLAIALTLRGADVDVLLCDRAIPACVESDKYAYHFFFRRMVPIEFIDHERKAVPGFDFTPDSVEDLLPGRDAGLDVLCDGILHGNEFIYPADRLRSDTELRAAV